MGQAALVAATWLSRIPLAMNATVLMISKWRKRKNREWLSVVVLTLLFSIITAA
jgi:hypothetical protein